MLSAWLDTEGKCESCFKHSQAERSLPGRKQHFLTQTLASFFFFFSVWCCYKRIISSHHQFSLPMYSLNMLPMPGATPPIYQLKISPATSVFLFFHCTQFAYTCVYWQISRKQQNALYATSSLLLLEDLLSLWSFVQGHQYIISLVCSCWDLVWICGAAISSPQKAFFPSWQSM